MTRTNGETTNRMMPAAPFRLDEYDGVVTFAVRVPLQAGNGASKDPFSFSMMFEVIDDDQTTVTQSLEEQADPTNVLSRSRMLNNIPIKTLPGSAYTGTPICQIRTAGTVANPLAFMVNSSSLRGIAEFTNQMFVLAGSSVNADFIQPMNAANHRTFSVNGSMTGLKTGLYTGAGTSFLSFVPSNTSSAAFPPNEEIEVTLSNGLSDLAGVNLCPAQTFKYRTGVTVPSVATFVNRSSYVISAN